MTTPPLKCREHVRLPGGCLGTITSIDKDGFVFVEKESGGADWFHPSKVERIGEPRTTEAMVPKRGRI